MNSAGLAQSVLFEERVAQNGKRIGIATLNAEKSLNALSLEMVDLLDPQLRLWAANPAIAIVVLQAAGEKAFSAGGDLQHLYRTMLDQQASDAPDNIQGNAYAGAFFEREYRLDYMIHTFPKPILAWGHGIVMGGGIGLMAGASHRVATEKSRFAMPEITIGLYPDVGGTWFLNRMPGHIGLFLALTGAAIGATDAIFAKLADYEIAQADKPAVFDALLTQPWTGENDDVVLTRLLQRHLTPTSEAVSSPISTNYALINQLCSKPTLPEIVNAILALKSEDVWLQKAAAVLRAGSPGSAALTFALLKRGRHLSLAEIFRLEYVVTLNCALRSDFCEGVRALIIDKDRQPKWQHTSLADVSRDWVNGFFVGPWTGENQASHPLADLRTTSLPIKITTFT
ncbi:enoyl-CoA hydratase/isomerase family protein [Glaciimonas immobilis]|nr:enoyl-CoA hydratase/isomerase family protein [Glaciimonas immobilis]KAF4000023.1 enoyl-CoA hydratase/isomerase family protein [Glaciimonas immobilis]